jgi:hypothetical protein
MFNGRWDDSNGTQTFLIVLAASWFVFAVCTYCKWSQLFPGLSPGNISNFILIPAIAAFVVLINEWLNVCFNALYRRLPPQKLKLKREWWQRLKWADMSR